MHSARSHSLSFLFVRSPAMRLVRLVLAVWFAAMPVAFVTGQTTEKPPAKKTAKDEQLTLEKLFPKGGLFGPPAMSLSFSHDGKYAAYLYRPYAERKHGSDLWVLDTATGKPQRVTSLAIMARYQSSSRKVQEQQQKKAKDKADAK